MTIENATTQFNGIPEIDPDSWLARAFKYVQERSQLPDNAIFWTLCAFCGAALRDRMYIDWATKPIFPNLPLLIVGESGLGKTGAKNAIAPLFQGCLPRMSAEDSTAEALTKDLAGNTTPFGNTAGFWIIPELADVLGQKDYQQGSIARLTRLFDNPFERSISRASQGQGQTILRGYTVLSWIAGTTFEWLHQHVDEAVSAGGFLPRVMVIHSQEPLKFVPNPRKDPEAVAKLNTELIQKVNSMYVQTVVTLGGEWESLCKTIFDERNEARGTNRAAFIARRQENILRFTMVLNSFGIKECGQTRPNAVEFGDFAVANECAKWFENQAITLSSALKSSEFGAGVSRVIDCLKVKHCVKYHTLSKNLNIPSRDLKNYLKELWELGHIKWDGRPGQSDITWLDS